MTRINLVPVENLADQHLFAEWREIKMVPAALRRSLNTKSISTIMSSIPKRYTLNTGHVTFFYDKMNFLSDRYMLLTDELLTRKYNIQMHDMSDIFYRDIPPQFKSIEWEPDVNDITVNVERILLRISERPDWYRYHGELVENGYFGVLYNTL